MSFFVDNLVLKKHSRTSLSCVGHADFVGQKLACAGKEDKVGRTEPKLVEQPALGSDLLSYELIYV